MISAPILFTARVDPWDPISTFFGGVFWRHYVFGFLTLFSAWVCCQRICQKQLTFVEHLLTPVSRPSTWIVSFNPQDSWRSRTWRSLFSVRTEVDSSYVVQSELGFEHPQPASRSWVLWPLCYDSSLRTWHAGQGTWQLRIPTIRNWYLI